MKYFLSHITHLHLLSVIILIWAGIGVYIGFHFQAFSWWTLLNLGLILLNGLALNQFTLSSDVTRSYSGMPMVLYTFGSLAVPSLMDEWLGQVMVTALLILLYQLKTIRRNENASEQAFLASGIIAVSALFVPDMAFLLPLLWIALLVKSAFTLRSFLASVFGVGIVVIYTALTCRFFPYEIDLSLIWNRAWLWNTQPHFLSCLPILVSLVFAILFGILAWGRSHYDKSQVQILLLTVLVLSIAIIYPVLKAPVAIEKAVAPAISLIAFAPAICGVNASIYFVQRDSVGRGVWFILYLLFTTASMIVF